MRLPPFRPTAVSGAGVRERASGAAQPSAHPWPASHLPPNTGKLAPGSAPPSPCPSPKACALSAHEVSASPFSLSQRLLLPWQSPGPYRHPYYVGNPPDTSFGTEPVLLQAPNQLLRTSPDLGGPGANAASSRKSSCIPSQLRQDESLPRHTLSPPCLVSITLGKDHDFPVCPTHR